MKVPVNCLWKPFLIILSAAFFILSPGPPSSADFDPIISSQNLLHSYIYKHVIPQNISNTGAATYEIPIEVPPGRGNIAVPDLALTYNSQGGNGWTGMGWNLDMGSIQRSTKMAVDYSASDFVFNGYAELVPRADWGTNYYGARIEGEFSKYYFNQSSGGWEVTAKDGTKYYYGTTAASRQDNPGNPDQVFKWCLVKVEDTNGNYMTVTYVKDQGQIYLLRIDYTGNSGLTTSNYIRFLRESRTDIPPMYNTDFEVKTAERLKTIEVYGNGQLARKYVLEYEEGTSSKRSRLTEVQVYGSNGTSTLPPDTFAWQEGGDGTFGQGITSENIEGDNNWFVNLADVNGDGFDDLIRRASVPSSHYYVYLSDGSGSFENRETIVTDDLGNDKYIQFRDINGDGFADLIRHSQNHIFTYLSNGDGTFGGKNTSDTTHLGHQLYVHCVDINGDGLADFIKHSDHYVYTYLSIGNGLFGQEHVSYMSDFGNYIHVHCVDVNGDGLADFVRHDDDHIYVYLSNGDGTFGDGNPITSDTNDDGNQTYVDFGDVNGDGLADLIKHSSSGNIYTYLSKGDGTFGEKNTSYTNDNGNDSYIHFADINGDGLTDLIRNNQNGYFYTYLATGDGTFGDKTTTETNDGYSIAIGYVRFADINGNGLMDLFTFNTTGTVNTHFSDGLPPDLLTTVDSRLGSISSISYQPSSQYQNTLLPFIVDTVSSITVNDGLGNLATTGHTYSGGYYDAENREFRGFEGVVRTNPDNTTETTQFEVQDDYKKGRQYQVELKKPNETLLTKTTFLWQTYPENPDTWAFVKLTQKHTDFYDSPTVYAQEDYTYDHSHGGILTSIKSGTNAESVTTTNDYQNYGTWLWRQTQETIEGGTSGKTRETYYGYESGTGNMLSMELWLDGGANPTINMTYDAYGNRITETDARGNTTTTDYDTSTYTFPIKITYPQTGEVSHIVEKGYNYTFGKIAWEKDENGNTTDYTYDYFGRVIQVDYPAGGQKQTEYYDYESPRYVITRVKESASSTVDKYEYFDGLDRIIQTITFGEDNKSIVTKNHYDETGREYLVEGPFFSTGTGYPKTPPSAYPYVETIYDYRSRPVELESPDGSYGTVSTTFSYSGFSTTKTDPDTRQKTEKKDYLNRIIQVTEHADGGPQYTSYTYNAAGDMLTITDHEGNTTTNTYDTLGRKISMDDPDMGYWEYEYDANGNLISQTDERTDTGPGTMVETAIYNEYDEMRRVISETREIGSGATQYTTLFEYDLSGKPEKTTYPDDFYIEHTYLPGTGLLHTVTGSDSEVYATCTNYEPKGKTGRIDHGNSTYTTYTYDPKSTRLTGIVTTAPGDVIQDRTYQYSRAGDIQQIADNKNSVTYDYTYDNLHRLKTEESGGIYPSLSYGYNAIGNIMSKTIGTDTYSYTYDTIHKHAVKTINLNGTPYDYAYDENGNMTGGPDFTDTSDIATRSITYYADNMPAMVEHTRGGNAVTTDFVYDGDGKRAKKSVSDGSITYYLGDHLEIIDDEMTKYIFSGDMRLAKVTQSGVTYYHKDHLQSSTAMTDENGTQVEATEYMPFGSERGHAGTDVTNYKFTDQEWDDETGLYNYDARLYDPVIGRFICPDPYISPNLSENINFDKSDFSEKMNSFLYPRQKLNKSAGPLDDNSRFCKPKTTKIGYSDNSYPFLSRFKSSGSHHHVAKKYNSAFDRLKDNDVDLESYFKNPQNLNR